MKPLETAREGWHCSSGMPGQASVRAPWEEAVQGAASPWSACVNRERVGAQLFLGGIWVS